MPRYTLSTVLSAVLVLGALGAMPSASAAPGNRNAQSAPTINLAQNRSMRQAPSPGGRAQAAPNRGGAANRGVNPQRSTANRFPANNLANPYGGGLGPVGQALRDAQQDRRYRDYEKEVRRSNRDAAMTTAVIGLAGAVIGAAILSDRAYAAPVAPPPVIHCPPPAGRYIIERVLVREGYHLEERIWVPEYRDPATGVIVRAHYETHVRWMPPVYEERQVWRPY